MLIESTDDHSILDHALANIVPVATMLPSSVQSKESAVKSFQVTTRFAPAQKNERFDKLKAPGKTIKADVEVSVLNICNYISIVI